MRRDEVLAILTAHRDELKAVYHVQSLALFGSVARDEARPDSDVDLLVEFDRPVGLFHLFGAQHRLEDLLGRKVDLVLRDSLIPELQEELLLGTSRQYRRWDFRIRRILEAIENAQEFTDGMTLEQFQYDQLTRDAVSYNLLMISTVSTRVPDTVKQRQEEIPWQQLIDLGNLALSRDEQTSVSSVWEAITETLPGLKPCLKQLHADAVREVQQAQQREESTPPWTS